MQVLSYRSNPAAWHEKLLSPWMEYAKLRLHYAPQRFTPLPSELEVTSQFCLENGLNFDSQADRTIAKRMIRSDIKQRWQDQQLDLLKALDRTGSSPDASHHGNHNPPVLECASEPSPSSSENSQGRLENSGSRASASLGLTASDIYADLDEDSDHYLPAPDTDTDSKEDDGIHDLPEVDGELDYDEEAFEVMEMLGVDGQDGIFVDDVDANVLAAQPHDFARYLSSINLLLNQSPGVGVLHPHNHARGNSRDDPSTAKFRCPYKKYDCDYTDQKRDRLENHAPACKIGHRKELQEDGSDLKSARTKRRKH